MSGTNPKPERVDFVAVAVADGKFVTLAARVRLNGHAELAYTRSDDRPEPLVKVAGADLVPEEPKRLEDGVKVVFAGEIERYWNARGKRFDP